MAEQVRVRLDEDHEVQHFADPPEDDTAHEWAGSTACGVAGQLHWVPPEKVDSPTACGACVDRVGLTPSLEGDYPGPP